MNIHFEFTESFFLHSIVWKRFGVLELKIVTSPALRAGRICAALGEASLHSCGGSERDGEVLTGGANVCVCVWRCLATGM